MNANMLRWSLLLTPWYCVALADARGGQRGSLSRDVYLWANFHDQYFLERGQWLWGDWDGDQFMYEPSVREHPDAAQYVHPVTAAHVRRLARRYQFCLLGKNYTDEHLQVLQQLNIDIDNPRED